MYEFRGKCKKMSEELVEKDPSLRLVRGHYYCPIWGEQGHWWCEKKDGSIVDPTKDQFPSKGLGEYIEFNGIVECAQCEKQMNEEDVENFDGRYAFCSYACYGHFIGF